MKQKNPERLFLLDGMALAYRAYFSFISRPLINSKGENTSAIFGFANTLMRILTVDRPEHIAVVFDTAEPTFRHTMYEPYKATREKMPEDMSGQLEKLKEVVRAFNVPGIELPGYEADDIMGTLARRAERSGIETYLVTGDKDFMQLISPLIRMYRPGKQGDDWEVLGEAAVLEKFGVPPGQVVEVLAIIGDKSDNVPGVRGIGEKTAAPLVREYGTLDNIYEHLGRIPQKGLREKLAAGRDEAYLSRKLVTIDTAVPLETDVESLSARAWDLPRLRDLFTELEFRSLLRKLETEAAGGKSTPPVGSAPDMSVGEADDRREAGARPLSDLSSVTHEYRIIRTEQQLKELVGHLAKAPLIAVDTETTSTDPLRAGLVGISFATGPGRAWYVPVEDGEGTGIPVAAALAHLSPVLSDPGVGKVGQNIKFDMLVFASRGVELAGVVFDTMVASYILRPDGQHNMDALAAEHLGYRTITYDDLTGTGRARKNLRDIGLEKVADYAAEDADVTMRLAGVLKEKLAAQGTLDICEKIEFPLIGVLARMERTGVSLDTEYLAGLSRELEGTIGSLVAGIHRHAGEEFNVNSTQQLGRILFGKLGLPTVRKTKTGFSTDVGVLETLRHRHPIVGDLLEYRQIQKLKSTYIDALPGLVNPSTGRVHTSYNQTVALTGRLSSSDPNLQNIPIRTELGSRIRRAFIPGGRGLLLLSADYSQIELRIMAHVCAGGGLAEAFRNGEDIHTSTASKVFGVAPDAVTREMRRKAKEVNFGIMYGIGPFGLASRLEISQAEAREIIETYFARFPEVREYIRVTLESARRTGYVSTLLGRRRYLPDLASRNHPVRSNAERQAINMPIQGTAADMIKLAMISVDRALREGRLATRMLLQVHDELVFEVPRGEEKGAEQLIRGAMEEALPLSVPVVVDIGKGENWLEAG